MPGVTAAATATPSRNTQTWRAAAVLAPAAAELRVLLLGMRGVRLETMPPLAAEPDDSRRRFARLRELRDEHRLEHLSMGTSQDYAVAVEEGATIVRIGTRLYN